MRKSSVPENWQRWALMCRISHMFLVVLVLLTAGNLTGAEARTKSDVKLVLQVTVDGLRAIC